MHAVLQRRRAGGERRAVDVEGAARAVQRIDHRGRAIGPADAQIREPEDLGEGARHHDVVRLARRARRRSHSRCGGRTRRRPRRAPEARCRAGRRAAASPRRSGDRCRSDCWGWRDRRSCVRGVTAARSASTLAVSSRLRRDDRRAARGEDRDPVDQEPVLREDRLVAGREIVLREQASAARPSRCRRRCAPGSARRRRRWHRAGCAPSLPGRHAGGRRWRGRPRSPCGLGPSGVSFDESLKTRAALLRSSPGT